MQARRLFRPQELVDDIGEYSYPAPIYELPASPGGIRRPPVAMGQDNEYVYKELLQVSDEEYEQLREAGHIASGFADSVP